MSPTVARRAARAADLVIACNTTFLLAPRATALYAMDSEWWLAYPDAARFEGLKLCERDVHGAAPVRLVERGMPIDGRNSALRATQLAAACGATSVLLFGVDLDVARVERWHEPHPAPIGRLRRVDFELAHRAWRWVADDLAGKVEIVNCNPKSALRCFPFSEARAWN